MITHNFVNPLADIPDFPGTKPSDWNAQHKITYPLHLGSELSFLEIAADGSMTFVGDATSYDDLLVELKYENTNSYPSAAVLGAAASSTVSGGYLNLYARNGILWVIAEGGSIGRMVELTFEDIRQPPTLFFTGSYNGSLAHANQLTWVVYNHVTTVWDTLTFGVWVDKQQYIESAVTGFTAQHVSSTGQVKVGINHGATPTTSHRLYLDEVRLVEDNQPSSVYFKGGRALAFRNTGYIMAHYKGQVSHSFKVASDWLWHVHFSTLTPIPDGQTIIFQTTYSVAGLFKSFPSETTITATFTNNSGTRALFGINNTDGVIPAGEHLLVPCHTHIDGSNLTISSIVVGEVVRAVGTFLDEVVVLYTDFHVEKDTPSGSRTEYAK